MINQEIEQLLSLRQIDLTLDDIARREEEARTRLQESRDKLLQFKEQAKTDKRLLDDALKEHKMLDLDLKKQEEQIHKYTSQMYEVKTNKEYTALKDEIEKGKAANLKLEDRILQLMIREDDLKGSQGRSNAELAEMEKSLKQLEEEVAALLARMSGEREALLARRKEEGDGLGALLLRRYEDIRRARGGSPLARVVEVPGGREGACSECHITIRPQIVVEVVKQEELVACESCGRILYLETSQK